MLNVLSLFDGISCGQVALQRLGIKVNKYYASEINKESIFIAKKNFPNTIHLGDVRKIRTSELPKINLLFGGSPCQSFSTIGNNKGFKGKSVLFYQFVRVLKEVNPTYFLFENVKMKKEWQDIITKELGVEPVVINSSMVSAQNRIRLYWTNIPNITQPIDKKVFLKDVISIEETPKLIKSFRNYVPDDLPKYVDPYNKKAIENKSTSLRLNVFNGNMWIKCNGGYRNLTVKECEQLQTLPLGYTNVDDVAESSKKKVIGDGWTVDVISHILSHIPLAEQQEGGAIPPTAKPVGIPPKIL